ncbi:MAG: PQQ-binding-like beta-propeller repeat protein [Candidatus Aminicenantes bacterium]|nr:PQQ-binding-like beta-propeller repeat protein [Candidatus Aminicenantes bacterium]
MFRPHVAPYPTGVIFPVIQSQEISFEGEVIDPLLRVENQIVFPTRQGKVYAYDGTTRELLWEFQMETSCRSSLFLGQERFYIVDQQNTVYGLSLEGKLQWKSILPEPATGGVCEDETQVYLGTESGRFFALDREQGGIRWEFKADGPIHSNPVTGQNRVFFGCDDFNLYCLNPKGELIRRFSAAGRIRGGLLVDSERLYFGADDYNVYCLNVKDLKRRWKVKTGGRISSVPVAAADRVFFISMNGVLTCLRKNNGHIRWWRNLPSRTLFRPEIIQDRIIVTTRSQKAVCFDIKTGSVKGEYAGRAELRSSSVWMTPYLVVAIQDESTGKGVLQFLGKQTGAFLSASKASPQEINEEIVVTAGVNGFYLPQYEFYITRYLLLRYGYDGFARVRMGEEHRLVQVESEQNTWNWYPEQEGVYMIEVRVKDEKEKTEAKIPYLIIKKTEVTIE